MKSRLLLLALAATTGLLLSAIQILPALEFTHYSNRIPAGLADRLWGRVEAESHLDYVYRFSVGPWRLAEYLWPNFSGRQLPINRRWLDALPAEGHPWTPSLYMGVLPLLLALSSLRLRWASPRQTWLSWSVLLAVVASFGYYGLGWIGREMAAAFGSPHARLMGPPFGGLYWLMTLLLPGYVYFRYPAKLLVIAALGLSVLAARGWDRTFHEPARAVRLRRWLLRLAVLSLAGAAGAMLLRPFWASWLSAAEPDKLLGPLQAAGALSDLVTSLVQTAVLCGLFWWLLGKRGRGDFSGEASRRRGWSNATNRPVPFFILLLVAADLAVANGWMVVCVPASQWEESSAAAAAIERSSTAPRAVPCRVYRHPLWTPPAWQAVSSATRLADAARWDRDTLWPKYNLPARLALADVPGSMMLRDYEQYLSAAGRPECVCEAAAAEYAILPGDHILPGGAKMKTDVDVEDVSLWRLPQPVPRAWIVYDTNRGTAGTAAALALTVSQGERGPDASCRVSHYDPLRVEIEATLLRPGLVVLAEQFYPGWQLEVHTKGQPARRLPIVRANQVMRGAWLPAGEHRLVYRYRPASFLWGAVVSGLGWTALAAGAVVWLIRCHAHACRGHVDDLDGVLSSP